MNENKNKFLCSECKKYKDYSEMEWLPGANICIDCNDKLFDEE